MKKLLRKRSMLLVALLVGLCMPTVLRAAEIDEEDLEGKVYYIRNVATGLYLKYGGTWGTYAVEGRAAHPFALEAWSGGVYAIGSIGGYLASAVGEMSGLPMAATQGDSKWKLSLVDGTTDQYYVAVPDGRRLSSMSNVSGQVGLAATADDDNRQKWQFLTKEEIAPSSPVESTAADLTALIKASSFDLVDGVKPTITNPLHSSLGLSASTRYTAVVWPTTPSFAKVWFNNEDWNQAWELRASDPMQYNNSFISQNNVHSAFTVTQTIDLKLPAGKYTFTCEGFYARIARLTGLDDGVLDETMNVGVSIISGTNKLGEVSFDDNNDDINYVPFISKDDEGGEKSITLSWNGSNYDKEEYVAAVFRDNDDWLKTISFEVPEGGLSNIKIELSKESTDEKSVLGTTWQNLVACDNLTLTYHGTNPSSKDLAVLYYERVRAAYQYATTKLHGLCNSYGECVINENSCEHWTVWDNAIENVRVNGLSTRGDSYKVPSEKFAYLNGEQLTNKIDTEREFLEALAEIEEAYQAALAEHNKYINDFTGSIINPSFENDDHGDGNHLFGWRTTYVQPDGNHENTGAWLNSNSTFTTDGVDGTYLFCSYDANEGKDGEVLTNAPGVIQTVTGLVPGLYRLDASLTADPGNTAIIFANGYNAGVVAERFDKFEEATLFFLVGDDGVATLGAVGANNGLRYTYKYYYPHQGCRFKADNFRLTRICDVPNGKLRLALDEAKNAKFDAYGKASIDEALSEGDYENIYEQKSATSANVDDYVKKIHSALNAAAKLQQTIDADMTYAINNPNFEWNWADDDDDDDDEWSWETVAIDAGIREQENATYRTVGADGKFLFNTWSNKVFHTKSGWNKDNPETAQEYSIMHEHAEPLTQTLTGLPNGTYKLEAMVVSYPGETMVLKANGESVERNITYAKENGEFVSVECEVTDGNLAIEVAGKAKTLTETLTWYDREEKWSLFQGTYYKSVEKTEQVTYTYTPWFKADNFRLTLLKPQVLILDEKATVTPKIENQQFDKVRVKRTIKQSSNWSTFVLPFEINLDADTWLANSSCVVKELKSVDIDGEHVRLTFGTPKTTIEAGRPCIIKNEGAGALEYIEVEKVNVDTRYRDTEAQTVYYEDDNGLMRFHGVYHRRAIPQGAFFISSNKFYKAVGPLHNNPDMISGFRGYFEILNTAGEQGARAFSFRIGEDETAVEEVNNGPATVVAIYNLSGMRLDGMQDGVNILQMSDGTSIKVVIE